MCGVEITAEFITKQEQIRLCNDHVVYSVRKLSMKNSISEFASARNDDWGEAIIERLEDVNDLVAADAQYYNSCMKKLYQAPATEEIKRDRYCDAIHLFLSRAEFR